MLNSFQIQQKILQLSTMPIKLYWTLMSQPARAVKCLLQTANLQHSLQEINLMVIQTRSKDYLNINPIGKIPFIIDNGFNLGESSAILVYLCEKYPEQLGHLYGKTPKDRAKINQFLSSYQNVYRPVMFKILFLKTFKAMTFKKPIYHHQIKDATQQMMKALTEIQSSLKKSNTYYLAGDKPSIADILYFFQTTNLILYQIKIDGFKLVNNWFNRMLEIEQLKKLHEEWLQLVSGFIQIMNTIPVHQKSKL